MKLRNLILTVLAVTAVLSACKKEKPVFGVSADKTAVELTENGGTVAVQITTEQDWKVRISANGTWISADVESGSRNATITFTAQPNDGKDRKTVVTIIAGMAMERITFTQAGALKPGDGLTPETAWSASEARAWIVANLASGEVTTDKYYIKGIIHKVQTTFAASGTYGNAVFFISDDGKASSEDFEAYQVYYLEGKKWVSGNPDVAVGDEVILYGPITLFGSTPETAGKGAAYIYSHVSQGGGGGDDDYSKAEPKTVAEFIAAADKDTYYKLTGTVSNFNKSYCSFDLTDETGTIYVYSVLDSYKSEWSSKIKNGGTITIAGKYDYYAKNEKHEVVSAAILSYEDGQGGGGDDYSKAEPKTVAEFIAAADKNTYYKLTGTVSKFNATYCSFDLTDETGAIYVYSVLDEFKTDEWKNKIKNGGTITIAGKYAYYEKNQQHEVVEAALLAYEEGQGGGGDTGEVKTVTVAEFNAAAESDTQKYQLTGTIGGTINTQYGNFDLTDETGTVYVYGLTATDNGYGTKNDQSFASLGLGEGDNITIIGYRGSYQGKIEVMYAYFVKKNSSGGGGGDKPDYNRAEEKTVSEFIALADPDTYYKLTGVVSNFNSNYCSFDLTDVTGASIYVYSVLAEYKTEWKTKISNGGTIVIAGKYKNYNGKDEVVDAAILSFEAGQGGGGEGGDDDGSTVTFNQTQLAEAAAGGATVRMNDVVSFTNSSSYSGSVTELRIYKNQTLTISAASGHKITKVEFTCSAAAGSDKYGPDSFGEGAPSGYSYDGNTGTWTGSAESVAFKASKAQVRVVELKVSYE
ncbi:MAG: BACON domain-containing protein [Bacteroidales bacterium]|nr:BACON domain-containing protein [Bacteroidales bacterium]